MGLDIKLGERLEVVVDDRRAVSVIEAIKPNGRLVISEPMCGTSRPSISRGDRLGIYIFRGTSMLSCTVSAEDFIEDGGLRFVELEIRSKLTRIQRRDFVRFDTLLPLMLVPLENSSELSDNEAVSIVADRRMSGSVTEEQMLGGFTLDISGGGMRFFCKKTLPLNSAADCEVLLDIGERVTAVGRIVRCEQDLHQGHPIMGMKFIGIAGTLREGIIKYIFAEQLRRRQEAKRLAEGSAE